MIETTSKDMAKLTKLNLTEPMLAKMLAILILDVNNGEKKRLMVKTNAKAFLAE